MNRTLRTFPLEQMATLNALESIPPIVTLVTTVVGTTAATSQPVPSTSGVSLPNYLIPTPMVLVSTSSTSIPLGGMAQPHYIREAHQTHFHMGCLQSR